jgi:hypothetical protein
MTQMFDMPDEEFKATLQMLVPMVVETMTGRAVIDLFKKFGVMDYLIRHYEALHTTGFSYCVQDIDRYIEGRSAKA